MVQRKVAIPRRGSSRGSRLVAGLLALACLAPRSTSAQEWHELYADGVAALRDGQPRKAVDLLRRAVQKRPMPGLNVPTYGTNFEPRYFPHLRLAEAYLRLEAYGEARKALETSARLGIEPADERKALESRLQAALDAMAPKQEATPSPAPLPAPVPIAGAVIPPPSPPPVAPVGVDLSVPATDVPGSTSTAAAARVAAPAGKASPPPAAQKGLPAILDITSDPPGAQVFLDDEPKGRTDPKTGRLRLRELAPGRHRVRLSSEGRDDLIREIDIAEGPLTFYGVLPDRLASPSSLPPGQSRAPEETSWQWGLAAFALVLLSAAAVWLKSLRRPPPVPAGHAPTPSSIGSRSDPGTAEDFPMAFGEYSLVRRIGKGGMAVVYEAVRRGEPCALKRPLTGFLEDTRFLERFLREAELGRTLHHPNIIRIFDRGQVGTTPYFAMELIQGETLRERLDREGRLDTMLAARVTARVAEALDYAHNKGVIHRDLKPSNIMLERSGGVKVMDYGIARAQHLEGLTTTGSFLGTPSYAAPETVDAGGQPPSDLYSLGVVFFEMLTGSPPFRGDSAFAVLRSHCTKPPPVPSSLNYALSPELDRIVLRLLSKEPSERPTAEQLLNELTDYLAESP